MRVLVASVVVALVCIATPIAVARATRKPRCPCPAPDHACEVPCGNCGGHCLPKCVCDPTEHGR